ncbi:hypothetical protein GGF50DRAFT_68805, partial [Schizophyllum commune]
LVDDLLSAYDNGLLPYHSYASQRAGAKPHSRIHCAGLADVLGDSKAGRPYDGVLDPVGDVWHMHQTATSATDWKDWSPADDTYLRTGADLWQAAPDTKTCKPTEKFFGVRGSQLWRLPYWDVTQQLIVDPMHCTYLGDRKRHFSEELKGQAWTVP